MPIEFNFRDDVTSMPRGEPLSCRILVADKNDGRDLFCYFLDMLKSRASPDDMSRDVYSADVQA
jgi:hypothetical protein